MNNLLSSEESQPTTQRWDPIGASSDSEEEQNRLEKNCKNEYCHYYQQFKKIRGFEEQQELLSSSLFALTTHFAQVQFRLRQVLEAPAEEKDELLKSVEEFASRGTPDVELARGRQDEPNLVEIMRKRRAQQQNLLKKLKAQLSELENYTFESGSTASVSQKRKRKHKMGINLELNKQECHRLTATDLKQQTDIAMRELANLLEMKECLIDQLKATVYDLERFTYCLQTEMKQVRCICGCTLQSVNKKESSNHDTISIIQKISIILQMFARLYLDCGSSHLKKHTIPVNRWGDFSAYLEVAITKVRKTLAAIMKEKNRKQNDYLKSTKLSPTMCSVKAATKVLHY